ncbi:hypothetical protein CASFOL_017310 [Castilleja foliolosa]|uniref:Uncharacterized protein n=1 Tax=Castilleja foliolosa TaxID=1961234 RepID=A0ABD3DAP5_9LAMI
MCLRRSKTRARVHNAQSPKFACSSFKDVNSLFCVVDYGGGGGGDGDNLESTSKPSICHRNRSVKVLIRSLSQPARYEETAPEIRIPGSDWENLGFQKLGTLNYKIEAIWEILEDEFRRT